MTKFDPFSGAAQIAEDIRTRKTSACDVLDAYLERVERFNPALNAIICSNVEDARRRADELDKLGAEDLWQGPLHGVVGVKQINFMIVILFQAGHSFFSDRS